MRAARDLQEAVQAVLARRATIRCCRRGRRIHDHAPENAPLPHVTWGRMSEFDWSTASETGSEVIATLNIWTRAHGKKAVYEIAEAVRAAVEAAPLTHLPGHLGRCMRRTGREARYGPSGIHHGTAAAGAFDRSSRPEHSHDN